MLGKWWKGILLGGILLVASLPLLGPRFIPTHDGEYHFIRIYEMFAMLRAGYLFPRWAPDLAGGYGLPLFNFQYPLPDYLGALFHAFGFSLADSFKLTLAAGYWAAAVFCYRWLSSLFRGGAALLGTIVFAFVPYWFVDIYVRGSVGEVVAMGFLMAAFSAVESDRKTFFTVCVAGLILSHNIMAMLFVPVILAYILIRKRTFGVPFAAGLGLSSYFWVPALLERQYMTGINTVNFRDYFPMLAEVVIPSWGTGVANAGYLSGEMSTQIGIIPLVVMLWGILLTVREKRRDARILSGFFSAVALGGVFLMLSVSLPVWNSVPMLSYVQFPWRFLSYILVATAFLAGYISSTLPGKWMPPALGLAAVLFAYGYTRPVTYDARSDAYYLSKPQFLYGTTTPGDVFSTRWLVPPGTRPAGRFTVESGTVTPVVSKPLAYALRVSVPVKETVRSRIAYYPGWEVRVDGRSVPIDYRSGGLAFQVPKGQSTVSVIFRETTLREIADITSLLSLFWVLGSFILKKYAYRDRN